MSSPISEIPPHPLDPYFEEGGEAVVKAGVTNDPLFARAIQVALKVRERAEEERQKNPTIKVGSPARQARQAFLDVLNDPNVNP